MTTFRELLSHFGVVKTVDPVVNLAWESTLAQELADGNRNPHGRPWHVSFHASLFPGDDRQACPRLAAYRLMDVDGRKADPSARWLNQTAEVGKAIELAQVRRVRDAGNLARSNDPSMSTDPDTNLPQMGFVDREHWLTGSVDMPMMQFNDPNRPHIVEVKTKHESQIEEMQLGLREANPEHERQARCSLGMARENPSLFLHPTEDRVLEPAKDGAIYYVARDSKWLASGNEVPTHEFLIEHRDEFMEAGRGHLKRWKQAFLDDELVQENPKKGKNSHPMKGWMWSQGICANCKLKKICRTDFDDGKLKISESSAIAVATFTRTDYDDKATRKTVIDFWDNENTKENS